MSGRIHKKNDKKNDGKGPVDNGDASEALGRAVTSAPAPAIVITDMTSSAADPQVDNWRSVSAKGSRSFRRSRDNSVSPPSSGNPSVTGGTGSGSGSGSGNEGGSDWRQGGSDWHHKDQWRSKRGAGRSHRPIIRPVAVGTVVTVSTTLDCTNGIDDKKDQAEVLAKAQDTSALELQLLAARARAVELEKALSQVKDESIQKNENLERALIDLRADKTEQIGHLKNEMRSYTEGYNRIARDHDALKATFVLTQNQNKDLQLLLEESQHTIFELKSENNACVSENRHLHTACQQLQLKNQERQHECSRLNQIIAESNATLHRIRHERNYYRQLAPISTAPINPIPPTPTDVVSPLHMDRQTNNNGFTSSILQQPQQPQQSSQAPPPPPPLPLIPSYRAVYNYTGGRGPAAPFMPSPAQSNAQTTVQPNVQSAQTNPKSDQQNPQSAQQNQQNPQSAHSTGQSAHSYSQSNDSNDTRHVMSSSDMENVDLSESVYNHLAGPVQSRLTSACQPFVPRFDQRG